MGHNPVSAGHMLVPCLKLMLVADDFNVNPRASWADKVCQDCKENLRTHDGNLLNILVGGRERRCSILKFEFFTWPHAMVRQETFDSVRKVRYLFSATLQKRLHPSKTVHLPVWEEMKSLEEPDKEECIALYDKEWMGQGERDRVSEW